MQGKLPGCGCLDRLKRWAEWLDARGVVVLWVAGEGLVPDGGGERAREREPEEEEQDGPRDQADDDAGGDGADGGADDPDLAE